MYALIQSRHNVALLRDCFVQYPGGTELNCLVAGCHYEEHAKGYG